METEYLQDATRLSDALDAAHLRSVAIGQADARTAPARFAIRALARSLTEREAMALVACLSTAISESGWGHTNTGNAARESLTDAHWELERGAEL